MNEFIKFTDVCKSYGNLKVLDGLSFDISENDVIGVLGPSGAGKSTMLKLIGGIEEAGAGRVINRAERTGYVFQEPRLLPWKTAVENVMLPMQAWNMPREQAYAAAKGTLERMGLAGFLDHYPKQLSGGMIQRVSLARALAVKPDLLLMDEPFSALDLRLKELLIYFLKEHLEKHPATVVYISHAPDEVLKIAGRIFMFGGEDSFRELKPDRKELLAYYSEDDLNGFTDNTQEGVDIMSEWKEKRESFRLVDARGKTPEFLPEMIKLAEGIKEGDGVKVIQNFEPVPLYFQLEKMGFDRHTEKIADDEYHVYFYKKPAGDMSKSAKMADYVRADSERAEKIVNIITSFFHGKGMDGLRKEYEEIAPVSSAEFAFAEQVISDRGIPDPHIESHINELISLFRSSLDQSGPEDYPEGHPVCTYMLENRAIEAVVEDIRTELKKDNPDAETLKLLYGKLKQADSHYVRKEHQLFPYLERKGFDKPSTIMWGLHDKIRGGIKESIALLESGDTDRLKSIAEEALTEAVEMIYKEEKILLPTALVMLTEDEWKLARKGERELDYCLIDTPPMWGAGDVQEEAPVPLDASDDYSEAYVHLGEGMLTLDQINAIFRFLPVDVSFVDSSDRVRFYNQTDHRVFPRSPGVIGREVKYCHPPKSVDTVMEIISSFRSGEKDMAEFWLTLNERFIHIRYFAVRSSGGRYMGVLEMMQDVTDIRALEGSRTLLTWDK